MLASFKLEQPSAILFGPGTRKKLPEILSQYGAPVLLVTGRRGLGGPEGEQEFVRTLEPFRPLRLICPPGEPTSEGMEELLKQARARQPRVVLAVGGGSVLDTGKALSGLIPQSPRSGGVEEFLEGIGSRRLESSGVPWIAVPTTAGTGAEATKNAVIKVSARRVKRSLRSSLLLASCAVVDPELTLGCPLEVTGASGLDALCQLIESYVCRFSNPVTDALARGAFPVLLSALHILTTRPQDLEARSGASFGALVSGICLANAGLGAAHGLAGSLGGVAEIPHGLICGLFLGPVLRANAPAIRERIEKLRRESREWGLKAPEGGDPVEWLAGEVDGLIEGFGLPRDLAGYGIDLREVRGIAERAGGSSMAGNPRTLDLEEREKLLLSVIRGRG